MSACGNASNSDGMPYHIVPPPKAKSRCWKYFGFKATPSGEIIDKKRMICRLCKTEFSYSGNTTNLSQHLTRKHPHLESDILRPANTSYIFLDEFRDFPTQDVITVHSNGEADVDINFIIVKYLAKSMLPLKTVESGAFVGFVRSLRPDITLPNVSTLKLNTVPSMYGKYKQELVSVLQCVPTCSLSCYEWTNCQKSFLTISVHFINDQCQLQSRILKTFVLSEDNTSSQFIDIFQNLMTEWTLTKPQITAITTSNINDDDMFKIGDFLQLNILPCIDHVLEMVSDAIFSSEKVADILITLQDALSSINTDKALFDSIQAQLTLVNSTWKMQTMNLKCRHWHESYDMLSQIVRHKDLLEQTLNSVILISDQWKILEEVVGEMKPFYVIVSSLCQSDYVSLSLVKPIVSQLINKCCSISPDDSDFVQNIRKQVKCILERLFMNKNFDGILNMAAFVDPRFKVLGYMASKEKDSLIAEIQAEMLKYAHPDDKLKTESVKRMKKQHKSDISFLLAEVCENNDCCLSSVEERASQEVAAYRVEEPPSLECNPFEWWKMNWHRYPLLFNVAKVYLSIAATCQKTNCLYSKSATGPNKCFIESKYVDIMMFLECSLDD